jgi:hypothetical protein
MSLIDYAISIAKIFFQYGLRNPPKAGNANSKLIGGICSRVLKRMKIMSVSYTIITSSHCYLQP